MDPGDGDMDIPETSYTYGDADEISVNRREPTLSARLLGGLP